MVGACAAALAAADPHLADLRIAVLEAHPPAATAASGDIDLRVSAVSRASQRILAAVGAWPLVPQQSLSPYDDMIVWDAAGKPRGAGAIHFSASATSEPNLGHIVENRRLQWALYDCPPFRQRVTLLRARAGGHDARARSRGRIARRWAHVERGAGGRLRRRSLAQPQARRASRRQDGTTISAHS